MPRKKVEKEAIMEETPLEEIVKGDTPEEVATVHEDGSANHDEPMNHKSKKYLMGMGVKGIALAILAVTALGFGGTYFLGGSSSPAEANAAELVRVMEDVSNLMLLPEGELPVMATVTNAEDLKKEQAFYADVLNGDKVLIYVQNQKAIIYSPSRDVIVNVGPVVPNAGNQPSS